jgi:hypothetical protein
MRIATLSAGVIANAALPGTGRAHAADLDAM